MLAMVFEGIIITSCVGAAVALVLLLLKPMTKRHFGATWHYYIWLMAFLIMMLPIKLESSHLMVTGAEEWVEENLHIGELFEKKPEIRYDNEGHRLVSSRLQEQRVREVAFEEAIVVLAPLWLGVAILLFLERIFSYGIFLHKMKQNTKLISCPEIAEYTKRRVAVRTGAWVSSPQLVGIFRPTLLLPAQAMTKEQLHNVLAHEMTHLRRKDMLYRWFMVLVKCVHWFNPLIYPVCTQVNQECEISCDIAATDQMDSLERMSYVDTILALMTKQKNKDYALTMGMTGSKTLLKKRFAAMKNRIVVRGGVRLLSGLAAMIITVCGVLLSGHFIYTANPEIEDITITSLMAECEKCHKKCTFSTISSESEMEGAAVIRYLLTHYECAECRRGWTEKQETNAEYMVKPNGKILCVIPMEQLEDKTLMLRK